MAVDIGNDIDWTIKNFTKKRKTKIHGTQWDENARNEHNVSSKTQAISIDKIVVPKTKENKRNPFKGEP